MDGSFQLYKKSPFQFNNTPFILCAPAATTFTGKLSAYVKAELDKLGKFYNVGENPKPYPSNPVNGEEKEFYFSTNYTHWINLLKYVPIATEIRNAALALNYLLSELKQYNLLQYKYAPFSYNIDTNGAATDPYNDGVEVFSYFYDVLQIDIVPPSDEDLKARSTDPKPGNGNTVKGFAEVITIRLRVRRNKMLEAYVNGDFDTGEVSHGNIIRAARGFIIDSFSHGANEGLFSYPVIPPTGSNGTEKRERALDRYNDYYAFCVGTFLSNATGGSPRTVLVTFINTDGTEAATISEADINGIVTYTDAEDATYKGNGTETDNGTFTPNAVYIVNRSFFENDDGLGTLEIDTDNQYDIKAKGGYWLSRSVAVKTANYIGKKIYSAAAFNKTVTIGTNNTRVKVGGKLLNEYLDENETKPIGGDTLTKNIFLRMVFAKNGSIKISLNVNGEETDITDDFSVPLTASNVGKSELQAQKIARISNFIQQGGRIVTGAATAAAGVASGGAAFLPAAIAGGEQIFSGAAGIYSNIVAGAPKPTATQQGSADGVTNATTLGGLYYEEKEAENKIEINEAAENVGYNCNISLGTADGLGNKKVVNLFDYPKSFPVKDDNTRVLQIENAIFSGSNADERTKNEIEIKLRGGAVLCYGIDALKRKTGTA